MAWDRRHQLNQAKSELASNAYIDALPQRTGRLYLALWDMEDLSNRLPEGKMLALLLHDVVVDGLTVRAVCGRKCLVTFAPWE